MKNLALLLLAAASACSHHMPGHVEQVNAAVIPIEALPVNLQRLASQEEYVKLGIKLDGDVASRYAYIAPLAPVYGKVDIVHPDSNGYSATSEDKNERNVDPVNEKKKTESEPLKEATPDTEQKIVQTENSARPKRNYAYYVPHSGVYDRHGVRIVVPEVTDSYINYYPLSVAEYPFSIRQALLPLVARSLQE